MSGEKQFEQKRTIWTKNSLKRQRSDKKKKYVWAKYSLKKEVTITRGQFDKIPCWLKQSGLNWLMIEFATKIWKGKPLFEMCCFHMGIARKGGACQDGLDFFPHLPGGVRACQDGLWHFFFTFARFTEGGGWSYLGNAHIEQTHFKMGLPLLVLWSSPFDRRLVT